MEGWMGGWMDGRVGGQLIGAAELWRTYRHSGRLPSGRWGTWAATMADPLGERGVLPGPGSAGITLVLTTTDPRLNTTRNASQETERSTTSLAPAPLLPASQTCPEPPEPPVQPPLPSGTAGAPGA